MQPLKKSSSASYKNPEVAGSPEERLSTSEATALKALSTNNFVRRGVSMRLSDSAHYGQGNWDKIPFTVEVEVCYGEDVRPGMSVDEVDVRLSEKARAEAAAMLLAAYADAQAVIMDQLFPDLFGGKRDE